MSKFLFRFLLGYVFCVAILHMCGVKPNPGCLLGCLIGAAIMSL